MDEPQPPGAVVGQLVVIADLEVIPAPEPEDTEEETP